MDADLSESLNKLQKVKQFELGALTPGVWKLTARNLKRAADKLYDFFYYATLRDINRFHELIQGVLECNP